MNKIKQADRHVNRDDSGAVLVTVVVVMFVGFIIAATIAAAVMFTIGANDDNKDRTDAFIAAESGRDVARGNLSDGCASADLAGTGTSPTFSYTVYTTDGPKPTSSTGLTSACPDALSTYVVISSTGTGPDGSTASIDAVYNWNVIPDNVPGGVVTYFSGSVTQGVAHYTGDLVLRNGDWSCNIDGIVDGDLYILSGDVTLSNGCTVNGDIFSFGHVEGSSQGWAVNGDIVSDSYVELASSGGNRVDGFIYARGDVDLKKTGSDAAEVTGDVTSMAAIDEGAPNWTIGGTVTPGSATPPPFDPTLEWLRSVSKWIDLDAASGWGASAPVDCSKLQNGNTASAYVKPMLSAATTPLVLDFSGCANDVKLDLSAITVTRDAVIIGGPNRLLDITLSGLADDGSNRQLFFVHADGNRDDRDANSDPVPTCGSTGTRNTQDRFDASGSIDTDLRVMMYSPCGLTGTVTASFAGQLYTDDTTHFHADSTYICDEMVWPGALPELGCQIQSSSGGGSGTVTQSLGERVFQTEK